MALSVENQIFLEEAISGMDYRTLIFTLANNLNLSEEEKVYMIHACLLPKNDFDELLALYDNCIPKMDEFKFLDFLAFKYKVHREVVLLRIGEVKRMNKEIKKYQERLNK